MFKSARRGPGGLVETVETHGGQVLALPEAMQTMKGELVQDERGLGRRGAQFMSNYFEWLAENKA